MNGSFLHSVLHGGVSLRLDVVVNEVFDFSYVSFTQFYLFHGFPSAFLSCRLRPAFSKKLSLLICRHGWDNFFTRFRIIQLLNSLESVFALGASSIPNFYVRFLGAIAVRCSLSAALRAKHD